MEKSLTDGLTKEKTTCLKGIFAIFVLLHHLYQNTGIFGYGKIVGTLFGSMGYLSVGIFFFLSGYGLLASYNKKGKDYAKGLFRKRIIPFYLISLFFAVLDLALTDRSFAALVKMPFNFGGTGYLWYMEVQLFIYLIFWLTFRTKQTKGVKIVLFSAGVLMLICICDYMGLKTWWLVSTGCVIFGVLWANLKEQIVEILSSRKEYMIFLAVLFVLFCGFFAAKGHLATNTYLLSVTLSAVFFAAFVAVLACKTPIENAVTRFLGKISLEIYVMQHIFIAFFKGVWINGVFDGVEIKNVWVYCLVVTASTILASYVVHFAVKRFMTLKIWS